MRMLGVLPTLSRAKLSARASVSATSLSSHLTRRLSKASCTERVGEAAAGYPPLCRVHVRFGA